MCRSVYKTTNNTQCWSITFFFFNCDNNENKKNFVVLVFNRHVALKIKKKKSPTLFVGTIGPFFLRACYIERIKKNDYLHWIFFFSDSCLYRYARRYTQNFRIFPNEWWKKFYTLAFIFIFKSFVFFKNRN